MWSLDMEIAPWMVPFASIGIGAAWVVPALADRFPSRSVQDRDRLREWSRTHRILLAVAGVAIVLSLLVRSFPFFHLVVAVGLGAALLTTAAVDLRTERLPDRLTALALAIIATSAVFLGIVDGPAVWLYAGCGAALFSGVLEVVHRMQPGGMGRGDVKLAAVLGALIGVSAPSAGDTVRLVIVALTLAMIVTFSSGLLAGALRRSMMRAVPFGPGLVAASWLVAVATLTY